MAGGWERRRSSREGCPPSTASACCRLFRYGCSTSWGALGPVVARLVQRFRRELAAALLTSGRLKALALTYRERRASLPMGAEGAFGGGEAAAACGLGCCFAAHSLPIRPWFEPLLFVCSAIC